MDFPSGVVVVGLGILSLIFSLPDYLVVVLLLNNFEGIILDMGILGVLKGLQRIPYLIGGDTIPK